jgi:hypothetical protein
MCSSPWQVSYDGNLNRRRSLYIKEVQPQDTRCIKFFQDRLLQCHKQVGATATIFVAAHPNRISPERMYGRLLLLPLQDLPQAGTLSVCARRGLADPARTSIEGAAPTDPSGGVIDSMRQGSIVGSIVPLHGKGQQRSHASAGQPGRTEGENQLGPTTSHLGPCRRRTFLRTNQMCSTNSLRLRRRHHRLPEIHRRCHSC